MLSIYAFHICNNQSKKHTSLWPDPDMQKDGESVGYDRHADPKHSRTAAATPMLYLTNWLAYLECLTSNRRFGQSLAKR